MLHSETHVTYFLGVSALHWSEWLPESRPRLLRMVQSPYCLAVIDRGVFHLPTRISLRLVHKVNTMVSYGDKRKLGTFLFRSYHRDLAAI